MVISGGVNIYPAEIEACLISHPAVADCAVSEFRTMISEKVYALVCKLKVVKI